LKKDFIVQYSGLAFGKHDYDFEVGTDFFSDFEFQEVNQGNVRVDLVLEKSERMMTLDFVFAGEVVVVCDRCGEDLILKAEGEQRIIFKYGEVYEEADEVITLPYGESEIDVSQIIYEMIHLSLPMRKVHEDGLCDEKALERIHQMSPVEEVDPRWESLLKIKKED